MNILLFTFFFSLFCLFSILCLPILWSCLVNILNYRHIVLYILLEVSTDSVSFFASSIWSFLCPFCIFLEQNVFMDRQVWHNPFLCLSRMCLCFICLVQCNCRPSVEVSCYEFILHICHIYLYYLVFGVVWYF